MMAHKVRYRLDTRARAHTHIHRSLTHTDGVGNPSITEFDGKYDQVCSGSRCDGKDGTVNGGRRLSSSFYACKFCSKISCPDCIRTMWGQSEHLGKKEKKQRMFVCRSCSSRLGSESHVMSCPECNDVQYFKMDLRRCLMLVQKSSVAEKVKTRINVMVNRVCRNIDMYIGHVARDKIQSSFWPDKLQDWAQRGIYDEMLIISDFWRSFDGTYLRRINCDTGDKQSVETHCVWSVCPPLDKLDAQDVLRLNPGGCKTHITHICTATHAVTHTHIRYH